MATKKLFLIDAFAIVYRAYFAFGSNQRYNSKGLNTSATLGFTNTMLEVLKKENPTHIGVVFDSPGPTFREEFYPAYKANRDEMPEDIRKALPYIKQIITAMDVPILALEGYEADDIMGTLSKKAEKEGFEVYLMTPDKDFAQLVSEHIFLYRPGKAGKPAEKWGIPEVQKKFEVAQPEQVIDILGLWGDAADNIPGIPGIGEKTSKILVAKYGSVEGLLAHTDELKGKQKENVIAFAEQGLLSKRLATIALNVPVDFSFEALKKTAFNKEELMRLFDELEFRGLAKRVFDEELNTTSAASNAGQMDLFAQAAQEIPAEPKEIQTIENCKKDYQLLTSKEDIMALVQKISQLKSFCFDTETTDIDSHIAQPIGVSLSFLKDQAYYLPFSDHEVKEKLELLRPIFENDQIEKVGQNLKYDINVLKQQGIAVRGPLFDTMLAHYLLEPDLRHNMDYLSETYLAYRPISIATLIGKKGKNQGNMKDVAPDLVAPYACEDADITWQLQEIFRPKLEETKAKKLFDEIEMPLIPVLSDMELNGVAVDVEGLNQYSIALEEEIKSLEYRILDLAGKEFNVSSPKQLGEILFDHLQVTEKAKKTKTGQYQTNEETLLKLKGKHEIIEPILDFRQLKKLKSTYVDVLPTLVHANTQKIHTSFNQAVAATGRLSSNNPNLQNIPIKTEKGREVRKAFVASPGNSILAADYSQVELRLMAEISGDEGMRSAFQQKQDIHAATAAKVFDVPLEEVSKEMRGKAKMVNFGIIYGISAFGLSERLGISRKESAEIIKQYFTKYPKVQSYMDEVVANAKQKGYVETIMGRRRYLKDINSGNAVVRGYAERNAINAPIQGSAADIIKKAMIDIQQELIAEKYQSKMILQVHDELLFDVVPSEKEKLRTMVKEKMENAFPTEVPLEVDLNFGQSWLEAH